jgi:ribosomal protein L29
MKELKLKSIKDIDAMKEVDLRIELQSSEKKLFEFKMKNQLNELKQTHLIKPLRRYIAALKTVGASKGFNID